MDFTLQMVAFVDDNGYTVEIGTQVGFTEEAAKELPSPIKGLGDGSYIVLGIAQVDPITTYVTMVAIEHLRDGSGEYDIIEPMVTITVEKGQIGAI